MAVPGNSAQSWQAAFTGEYDDETIDLLVPFIEPDSLILDIGASLGFYTVPLALAARSIGGRVLAVEPITRNAAIVRHNVDLNGLHDVVTVMTCALGATHCQMTLHIESGGTGNATIVTGLDPAEVGRHDRAGNMGDAETVQVRPLDDLELPSDDRRRRCALVKIDVEGFEMDVLAGAASFIASHRPTIIGEFNPTWLASRGIAATAPGQWAAENRYSCWEIVHTRVNPALDTKMASLRPIARTDGRAGTDVVLLPDPAEV